MSDLIFKDEVYRIIGAAMEVYNEMGSGFHEPIYQESLAKEFMMRNIPHEEQKEVTIFYKDYPLKKKYEPDYIVYGEIVLEIKAMEVLTSREESQVINYLHATRKRLGLLVNFGHENMLEWKRFVL